MVTIITYAAIIIFSFFNPYGLWFLMFAFMITVPIDIILGVVVVAVFAVVFPLILGTVIFYNSQKEDDKLENVRIDDDY